MDQASEDCALLSSALLYEAAAQVLGQLSSSQCSAIPAHVAVSLRGWQGEVDFRGPREGLVGLRVPTDYASALVAAMAGDDDRHSSEMQADAVGEATNILSARLVSMLFGARFRVEMGSPRVCGGAPVGSRSFAQERRVAQGLLVDKQYLVNVWLCVALRGSAWGENE